MKIAPLIASFVLLAPTLAAAWSSPAHQAITQAAQDRLDPGPRKALAKILQGTNVLSPGVLASVATWPDDVRARAHHGTVRGSVNELPTRFDCAIAVASTTDNATAAVKSSSPRR